MTTNQRLVRSPRNLRPRAPRLETLEERNAPLSLLDLFGFGGAAVGSLGLFPLADLLPTSGNTPLVQSPTEGFSREAAAGLFRVGSSVTRSGVEVGRTETSFRNDSIAVLTRSEATNATSSTGEFALDIRADFTSLESPRAARPPLPFTADQPTQRLTPSSGGEQTFAYVQPTRDGSTAGPAVAVSATAATDHARALQFVGQQRLSAASPQRPTETGSTTGPVEVLQGSFGTAESQVVQEALLAQPPEPTPQQVAQREAHDRWRAEQDRANVPPIDPVNYGKDSTAAPTHAGDATPPGDFVFFRNTIDAPTGASQSNIGEPNAGNVGRATFQTGNWYGSVSGDHGANYQYVNPYSLFPTTGAFRGGFCCDQRVANDPGNNMVLWSLQYNTTGNTANDTNGIRLARSRTTGDLLTNSWTYWDFPAQNLGYGLNRWLDFPHLQASSTHLYLSYNVYGVTGGAFGSVIWRIPLSEIAAGGTVNFVYWQLTQQTPGFVNGAGAVMNAATIENSNAVRVWTQSNANTTLSSQVVSGLATTYFGTHTSLAPNGQNWTGRADTRMQSGWRSGNTLGFM